MSRGRAVQLISHFAYFAVSYIILFLYASDYFCSPSRGQARPVVSAKLAFACTIWDVIADVCGAAAVALTGKRRGWLQMLVSTLVVGFGLASIPSWIYGGHGHFLFEDTWADVSCFFTEGSGMMFPMVVATLLAGATLIRGWMCSRALASGRSGPATGGLK